MGEKGQLNKLDFMVLIWNSKVPAFQRQGNFFFSTGYFYSNFTRHLFILKKISQVCNIASLVASSLQQRAKQHLSTLYELDHLSRAGISYPAQTLPLCPAHYR